MRLYANYGGTRKVSGELKDKVFHKKVKLGQKLFILNAYGFDEENVKELRALGCEEIRLNEQGTVYLIDFQTFVQKAVPRKIGKFGVRYYLPLESWKRVE